MLNRTRALIGRGNVARAARDWATARDAYRAALRRDPALAPIWVQLGHMLRETSANADALAAYRQADAIQPRNADTQQQIGRTLALLGDHEGAIAAYERALEISPAIPGAADEARALRASMRRRRATPRRPGLPEHLRFVNLGTTGTCNASCVHCPTGKPETAHVPRATMPMALFEKIIDGIDELGLTITDQVAFGMFGDGLLDPLVARRGEYLRSRMPDVQLTVNTNGAAFNAARHERLNATVSVIALHCESLIPETYDYLMQPLRAERVFPKYQEILDCFPGKVVVSVPASRRNLAELPDIRRWFLGHGARDVVFDPLSSRCAEDRSLFDSLALNPQPIRCSTVVLEDLIVDCDGKVLICCQDFQRLEGIGDLMTESMEAVLTGLQRRATHRLLAEGRHEELATCSRCHGDIRGQLSVPG
jgi:tetratricopeptide (TPR) repeat protein